MGDRYEQVEVASPAELRAWLAEHHADTPGIWLATWKKGDDRHVTYDEIVCEVLCFGWVDSKSRALDERRSMLLLTPRKPRSAWSRPNKERVARLEAEGLMTPAGAEVVAAAKASGTWTALDAVERLEVPDDLAAAFDAVPGSREEWDAFPRSARRGILEWIMQAKRAPTRAKRVEETARLAGEGIRANQWRPPKA